MKLNDAVKIIIHETYKDKIPLAYFNYAESLTFNKRYEAAIKEFQNKQFASNKDLKDAVYFHIGWSFHELNKKDNSLSN